MDKKQLIDSKKKEILRYMSTQRLFRRGVTAYQISKEVGFSYVTCNKKLKELEEQDIVISKTRPNAFYKTELKQTLDNLGVQNLILCGIQSEMCVDTTCRQASDLEYNVILVKDGHTTFDSPVLKAAEIIKHHNFLLEGWAAYIKTEKQILF